MRLDLPELRVASARPCAQGKEERRKRLSRNLRAVKIQWGPCASLVIAPEAFEKLAGAVIGGRFAYEYKWNNADEVFKLWVEKGSEFLDTVRDGSTRDIVDALDKPLRRDAFCCLRNLKSLEPDWRAFIDRNRALEVWVDGY
jgi:hypothetical protein